MARMPSSKDSATTVFKTQFVKIPRISPPLMARTEQTSVYRAWLENLLAVPQNKKTFLRIEKDGVDECYRLQATRQFARGNEGLERALAEIDRDHNKDFWKSMQNEVQDKIGERSDPRPAESLEGLTLPRLNPAQGVENKDIWKTQSYENFVQQLQRINPYALLTKPIVDAAFHLVTTRLSKSSVSYNGRDSTITRILGKESSKYWKGK